MLNFGKSARCVGRRQQLTCRDTMFLCRRVRMIATSRFRSSTGFRRLLPAFASLGVLALCASNSTFFTIYTQSAMLKTCDHPETKMSAAAQPEHDLLCSSHDMAYCKIQPATFTVHVVFASVCGHEMSQQCIQVSSTPENHALCWQHVSIQLDKDLKCFVLQAQERSSLYLDSIQAIVCHVHAQEHSATRTPAQVLDHYVLIYKGAASQLGQLQTGGLPVAKKHPVSSCAEHAKSRSTCLGPPA